MTASPQPKSNFQVVYTIVERPKDGKKFWLRIGAAFTNRDGSINVRLDAIPVNGELQIREYEPDRRTHDSASGGELEERAA